MATVYNHLNRRPQWLPYPCDSNIELFRAQGHSDEAAWEVSLFPLQQVFALVQSDVEHSRALARMSGRLKLQRDLQLADCEVVAEIVGYGGDWAEWVGGDGSVKLGHACRVQLPAHQLQVAQVPEAIWGVTEGQAGFSAGGVGGSPMVVGSHSLREVREVIRDETCLNLVVGCVRDGTTTKNSFLSLGNSFSWAV